MPADVTSCSRSPFLQKEVDYGCHTNPEVMSGYMTLVSPSKHRQPVHVKVYRTSLEHFAVVCPQKKVCRPLGVLNLRSSATSVERLSDGLLLRQPGFDTPMCLTLIPEDPRDLDDWVTAFTTRGSPAMQSCLPVLEEDEESV